MKLFNKSKSIKIDSLGASLAQPPASVTKKWISLVALAGLFGAILLLRRFQVTDSVMIIWAIILSISVPVVALEFLVFGKRYGRIQMANKKDQLSRCFTKFVGFVASFLVMSLAYWLFPYYNAGYADVVYDLLSVVAIPLIILAPLYIWFIDSRMIQPKDEFYMAGLVALGRWHETDLAILWKHCRAWIIKIFFFPYIIHVTLPLALVAINVDLVKEVSQDPFGFMNVYINSIWLIDVAFSCTGYFITLRLFDSQVRSADPNMLGWVVCMICYGPFYVMLAENFLSYEDNYYWGHWLADYPVLKTIWAIPIILLLGNYAFATMQFGIRFSNLTHRGIITSGPFRLTKHPQYISKNIAWWLISIPFINESGIIEATRLSLMLIGFNIIFYYRAKTEEKHLSADPDYRAYASWIKEHGIFARLRKFALALI